METRRCGPADLELSVFGLGTMTFGAESDEGTAHAILDAYYESGGRFIDTADVYSRGVSEQIIGSWLESRAVDDVIVATKARFAMGDGPGESGAGRAHLTRALEASLSRLRRQSIDLYQVHAWDPLVPIAETLETLDGFVRSGKARHVGVSNFTGWQIERTVQVATQNDWAPIVSVQPQYNLLAREIEWDVVPPCLEHGLGLLPWSPLGGGWLTGKYSPNQRPVGMSRLGEDPGRGVEAYDLRNTERTWKVLGVVRDVAERRSVTMSQVALNWLRSRPGVVSVLLGCRTVEQLNDNLAALAWDLDEAERTALTEVSAPGMPTYPYGFLEKEAGLVDWERLGTRVDPVM
jgi:aryl-alcohol dehydrogenase-like predicted oxidoreductase